MKKLTFLPLFALLMLAATSCKKEVKTDNSYSIPNGALLTDFYANELSDRTQTFTISATDGGSVTAENGMTVGIAPGSLFYNATQPVTGDVTITLIEVYDRGSMATLNKATMGYAPGIAPNDTLSVLISGGEYYLRISQNGTDVLAPSGVAVTLPAENTGAADPGMVQFDGLAVGDDLNWVRNVTGNVQIVTDMNGDSHYLIVDKTWGWTSAAKYFSSPADRTLVKVQMPMGFTTANCELFITYGGQGQNLGSLDTYDGTFFTQNFGLIPVGMSVNFIAVTLIDGELFYAIQSATIEEDHIQEFTADMFYQTTASELTGAINALP